MELQVTGKALVRSEFEAILYELNEAQAANERRRIGEPIGEELTAKVIHANQRLGYVARILLGGAMLAALLFLAGKVVSSHLHHHPSDAKTYKTW